MEAATKTTVVVVEDERIVALNLKQRLTRLGYEVIALVTSGEKALEAITADPPDIVLMDIHIDGDMDGIETAARIPETLHIPVIYLTAYSEEATLERARRTRPYGYLLKPFSERELHASMQMVLERRRADDLLRNNEQMLQTLVDLRTAELQAKNAELTEQVAQRQKVEESLIQAQKMETIGQLTGGVAHDFNNLLTPIIGGLDILRRLRMGGAREQRIIQGALTSAERAKTVVQRLLAFARRQPLQVSSVNVAQLLSSMADLLGNASSPRVQVEVLASPDLPPAHADPAQLEMAILNLIVNARDAMPDGGRLTISAELGVVTTGHASKLTPGEYIRLCVADTGEGMDEATLARAIEPFFSTKGIGKGTGLGLSMAHGVASQLGGALLVSSTVGVGTTVELWLPLATGIATPQHSHATSASLDQVERGLALLVDDEDLVRSTVAELLVELGYRVIEVSSGVAALDQIGKGQKFDLLLTDHMMPGMTGVQLIREAQRMFPSLPAILMSGYADVQGVAPDLARLVKPFRLLELANGLAALRSPC